uniref:hypothetical protein n=1 Tax=Agathobacter sp. TaxID=2021311 RepID=UPI004056DDEE
MEREKRLAVFLALGIGAVLLICTAAAQMIYWKLLPQVEVAEGDWKENGFVLPKEALYTGIQGECVYYIEEREGRFQTEYIVKEVLVTVVEENMEEGTVTVRGVYNPDWVYASNADSLLQNGVEVKIVP